MVCLAEDINDSLKDAWPAYIDTTIGTTPLTVPSDWEIVFVEVDIGNNGARIIPFTIMRGAIGVGNSYSYRNGYYDGTGNYAFVSFTARFNTNGSLVVTLNNARLTGTEYASTSRLSLSYMKSLWHK